jgi:acid phosphatase family membrane protein YuiD
MEIFYNFPLWVSLFAILSAQFIKIPINFLVSRKIEWGLFFSTGGMPSSHSSGVTALSTAIALEHGFNSAIFAVAAILSIIVMYDAKGIRRHAGKQAVVINTLVRDFQKFTKEAITWQQKGVEEKRKELKELLGHEPSDVFFGALFGIIVTLLVYFLL